MENSTQAGSRKRLVLALTATVATIVIFALGLFVSFVSTVCLGDGPENSAHCNKTSGPFYFYVAAFAPAAITAVVGVISVMQRRTWLLVVTIALMLVADFLLPDIFWGNLACHNGCA